ncbi:hypothetical protein DPMN_059830 [Dreissena polymorpha]|uniref:Uncharacterized protein n=1 Tax=Dreissena polymorpha TaxID=45954 RepID=A0A9D4HFB6_DREPO|nr:hypothetical protein DPMN_059830 [Dreissena polymorpha]
MGHRIAEIDRIVIREVQYQFEVNRCRNEEVIVKGNFGWAWPIWPGHPRIDRIVIREAQYQFEEQLSRTDGRTDAHHHNIPTFSSKNKPRPNPPKPKGSTNSTFPVSNVAKDFQGARGSLPQHKRVGGLEHTRP